MSDNRYISIKGTKASNLKNEMRLMHFAAGL